MGTNVQSLEGQYQIKGNQLTNELGLTLQIGERKNPTKHKPKYYLRRLRPFDYISSMYQVSINEYQIDYSGKKYSLYVSDTTAKIVQI